MVFNGFSMVFRQVVGTMPSVESSTILSNLTREGFGYNFTARMRNCSGSEFDYVEVQVVEYSYIQLPTRAWLTGKTPINGGCLYIIGELSIAMFM